MSRRHKMRLLDLLEDVAYLGYAVETKEFFIRAYGQGQQRFTQAVRDHIFEMWEEIIEQLVDDTIIDLTGVEIRIGETPRGMILIARKDIFWED